MKTSILAVAVISMLTAACGSEPAQNHAWIQAQAQIQACVQRGHDYYDSLGFGTGNRLLSTGRMRDDEVQIRCERQPRSAF